MGDLIRQQRFFLQLFVQTSSAQRKALLDTVTQPQLKVLSEIAYNTIRGKVSLTPMQLRTFHVTFLHPDEKNK